jgi:LmbE family N-acetylglucosaminyl deacetylase
MKDLAEIFEKIDKKTLVAVFPHPDDETFASGGILLKAHELGWKTIVITLTKGGAGQNAIKNSNEKLKLIREKEYLAATRELNVSYFRLMEFPDGNLRETEERWSKIVLELLNKINPGLIITFDHSGITGHPDHIILSVKLKDLIKEVNSRPILIWYCAYGFDKVFNKSSGTYDLFSIPTHKLRLPLPYRIKKVKAFLKNKSQIPNLKFKMEILSMFILSNDYFHLVNMEKDYEYRFVDFKI